MSDVLGEAGEAKDEEWHFWVAPSTSDPHSMTDRMHDVHEVSVCCWCRPIMETDVLGGSLWVHNDIARTQG